MAVYPRSRGEHPAHSYQTDQTTGLSPLARGTLINVAQLLFPIRFIPARAGNTACRPPSGDPRAVYPRSRGEHCGFIGLHLVVSGLSPLARGTQWFWSTPCLRHRFIPARAGNTLVQLIWRTAIPVYPRSRGEHHRRADWRLGAVGLSPLARGTLTASVKICIECRFIPARAGNT